MVQKQHIKHACVGLVVAFVVLFGGLIIRGDRRPAPYSLSLLVTVTGFLGVLGALGSAVAFPEEGQPKPVTEDRPPTPGLRPVLNNTAILKLLGENTREQIVAMLAYHRSVGEISYEELLEVLSKVDKFLAHGEPGRPSISLTVPEEDTTVEMPRAPEPQPESPSLPAPAPDSYFWGDPDPDIYPEPEPPASSVFGLGDLADDAWGEPVPAHREEALF